MPLALTFSDCQCCFLVFEVLYGYVKGFGRKIERLRISSVKTHQAAFLFLW